MVDGIRTIYSCELNKGFGSRFWMGSQVWLETPEKGQRTLQQKCCKYNNDDEDDLNTLIDKNLLL